MTIKVREHNQLTCNEISTLLDRRPFSDPEIVESARAIVLAVQDRGNEAVIDYTRQFDRVELHERQLRVSQMELDAGARVVEASLAEAITHAIRNIKRFHAPQCNKDERWLEVEPGVWCGERWSPIQSVCIYVPRGRGAFSSVACMLGVPAVLAGVDRIVVCTPPGPDGEVDAATLFACQQMGIDEVYRIGGAQAVAAVAYGTSTIPKCEKIVGPGNVYVSAARRLLSDQIDPGSPAGPSESLIICDESADASNAAWNLLIEAEHGENSTALLLTHSKALANSIVEALNARLRKLSPQRREFASIVLEERGGVILTEGMEESIAFANRFAAEHVALMVRNPCEWHSQLTTSGEIIFGDYPIISLANYAMGMNAILPTGGACRYSSAVSVNDFGRTTSLGYCTRQGFESLRSVVSAMSRDEGFSAHHLAAEQWSDTLDVIEKKAIRHE